MISYEKLFVKRKTENYQKIRFWGQGKCMGRIILHCDMNNFYASVECMLDRNLSGKPVAVCGDSEERHGIVLAKNYIAASFGIKTAETVISAKNKCSELVIVKPHFETYMRFSELARNIYSRYTEKVEAFGLDECWLDVSDIRLSEKDGVKIANEIRETVKKELSLTVSVGVSFNKVFAKLGSDLKKPDAVTLIPRDGFLKIIGDLPASNLLGVGHNTSARLNVLGINTIRELAAFSESALRLLFGKSGSQLWKYANGFDSSPVVSREPDTFEKSISNGMTFPKDLTTNEQVWRAVLSLVPELSYRLDMFERKATEVSIVIKDNEFNSKQWQYALQIATKNSYTLAKTAYELFSKNYSWSKPVRAVTVRCCGLIFANKAEQITLFSAETEKESRKNERLGKTVEELRSRYGMGIIKNASLLKRDGFGSESTKMRFH